MVTNRCLLLSIKYLNESFTYDKPLHRFVIEQCGIIVSVNGEKNTEHLRVPCVNVIDN